MPVQKTSTTRYPDLALFLALIPFISAFNFYLTYVNIRLDTFHLIRFAVDTLQGYAAWLGVHAIILYLDRTMPYEDGPTRRIAVQMSVPPWRA
jgi:hypothetical protein